MTNPPYNPGPHDPYGNNPYGGPPTGDHYVPGQAGGPQTNGYGAPHSDPYGAPPPTDAYGAPPPTDPYGARPPTAAYEAQPQGYGGYGQPQPAYDGGSWNEPPKKNKQWTLIAGALVALAGIAVAVIILAINSGDDDPQAGGGDGGGGGDTTTSQTPEPSPGESMEGSWEVTSTITLLTGVGSLTNSDGDTVDTGDQRWKPHTWEVKADGCTDEKDCVLSVTDLNNNDEFELTLDGDEWTATYDSPFQCTDQSYQTVTVEVSITRDDESEELTGTMKTADNGSCGPTDNMKIEEDISLSKK